MHTLPGTKRLTTIATGLLIAAACGSPSEPPLSGACIGVTNVGGVSFVTDEVAIAQDRIYTQGAEVVTIARRRPCQDTPHGSIVIVLRLLPGESNALNAGTKLCAIQGESPAHRLMVCDRDPREVPIILTSQHDEPID